MDGPHLSECGPFFSFSRQIANRTKNQFKFLTTKYYYGVFGFFEALFGLFSLPFRKKPFYISSIGIWPGFSSGFFLFRDEE